MSTYQRIEVGKQLDGFKGRSEGVLFEFDASGALLIIMFDKPTAEEIAQVAQDAPFEIRFTELADEMFVTVKCGTLNWMDAPYSPHLSQDIPDTQEVEGGAGIALQLVMVDVSTGLVKSLRIIGLGTSFSRSFLRCVKSKLDRPFDRSKYDFAINSVYAMRGSRQIADAATASNRYKLK